MSIKIKERRRTSRRWARIITRTFHSLDKDGAEKRLRDLAGDMVDAAISRRDDNDGKSRRDSEAMMELADEIVAAEEILPMEQETER